MLHGVYGANPADTASSGYKPNARKDLIKPKPRRLLIHDVYFPQLDKLWTHRRA